MIPTGTTTTQSTSERTHKIAKGDNPESIAKKYGLTANDVMLQYANAGYAWMFHQNVCARCREGMGTAAGMSAAR